MIDITFDFETCALCPTAAVMSIGAVAWNRDADGDPFGQWKDGNEPRYKTFAMHVDLRSSFLDGFTFDKATSDWWAKQNDEAKRAVLESDNESSPCSPVKYVVSNFFDWIIDVQHDTDFEDVSLWSQGTDFDIAILRNICNKYNIKIPVSHKNFRDHRTFYMEGAKFICDISGAEFEPRRAYALVDEYNGAGQAHDPVYDCKKSIYSTWQMMKYLRSMNGNNK